MRACRIGAGALAAMAALAAALAAGAGPEYTYDYDAAGRLVRVGDGSGRYLRYELDASGNVRGTSLARYWHTKVAKPAKGAWVLAVEEDGTVGGFGADEVRGFYDLGGTLEIAGGLATGTIEIRDPETAALLASFPLGKSRVKADKGTGEPIRMTLTSPGDGSSGALKASAAVPGASFAGFRGVFASPKNQAVVPAGRLALSAVRFAPEGTRPAVTRVSGPVTGTLVADPSGKAYGELALGEDAFIVLTKLKAGTKSVKAKAGRGSPAPLRLAVKR